MKNWKRRWALFLAAALLALSLTGCGGSGEERDNALQLAL